DKDDARVEDKDVHLARVGLLDIDSGKSRQLSNGKWRITEIEGVPDGSKLIAAATNTPESDENTDRIYSMAVGDGKMTELAAPKGPFGRIRISPDGAWITFVGSRVDGPSPHDLYMMPMAGGPLKNLTAQSDDRPVQTYTWISDKGLWLI